MKQIHELGALFEAVQAQNILGDGKTFPDCIPLQPLEQIQAAFAAESGHPDFDLAAFLKVHFALPKTFGTSYRSDVNRTPQAHISALWNVLTRQPDEAAGSLIPLPHPYVVPGGRFREIYYWDSYFTMLGLRVSGRLDLIEHMVDNFAYLIDAIGYIPNGNRTYFLGRSQPPFFSLMVNLLCDARAPQEATSDEPDTLAKYLPALEKEYRFWMTDEDAVSPSDPARQRVVRLPDGENLNRYWDAHDTPRPEAYKEDVELAHQSTQPADVLFRHLRAAAESGWDFSSRWFRDEKKFATIHTTDLVPVDLNCLLYHLEKTLAEAHQHSGNRSQSVHFLAKANARKTAIKKYCWSEADQFFVDYDFVAGRQKRSRTLAAAFPLFFEVATPDQALAVEQILTRDFLKTGGLTTTLSFSGQQWDAPNGWAPLQWIAYRGLLNYGFDDAAAEVKRRWLNANTQVYRKTGKMTEKYDVWNADGEASGGEYPNQDGFGWTNGVFLAMSE